MKLELEREKAIANFQISETYSIAIFYKYFKGFELFQRWTMKHHPEVNYVDLDFEAIDKEMLADEVAEEAYANERDGVKT